LIDLLGPLFLFSVRAKIILHIIPGLDFGRNDTLDWEPVEPWNKSQDSVEDLLEALNITWQLGPEQLVQKGYHIDICLDIHGECVITEVDTVWSPLGWLMRVIEWAQYILGRSAERKCRTGACE
jgi:hypothetical protein